MSSSSSTTTTIINNEKVATLSKKLVQFNSGDQLYLGLSLGFPSHNLRTRKITVFIAGSGFDGSDYIKLLGTYACLCEPSGVLSTRSSSSGVSGSLNDIFIDPMTRLITILAPALTPKEVTPSNGHKSLSIKIGGYGKNPGKSQIKFLTLVFEICYCGQFYNAYITMKTQRGTGVEERGCTTKESCFISDVVQNQEDEFIQALFKSSSSFKPSKRRQTPQKITKLGTVMVENQFVRYLEGTLDTFGTNSSDYLNFFPEDPIEEYPNPQIDAFSGIICVKIHFETGPKEGGQPNTLYLSFKDSSRTGLYEYLKNHAQSVSLRFIPQIHPEIEIDLPQVLHISNIGNYAALHLVTSKVASIVEGDVPTWVFLTINNEIIEGAVEYTFVDSSQTVQSLIVQPINSVGDPDDKDLAMKDTPNTPVVTILNIGQFAKQQYQQSKERFQDVGTFIANFQKQFGKIIDVFGYNFAGFLKANNFSVQGVVFEEVICPDISNEKLITIKPAEVRHEEKIFSAEESTDMIIKSIENRIPLIDEKMIENSVQTLIHKKSSDLDAKQGEEYVVSNTVVQKHLETNYNPGKRHARTDKVPYLNLKFVIFDAAALPSQEAQNIQPKLKVALFFAKFVMLFDENTHSIVIEDQEKKENFLYQTFYDCNIYTVRKSDEIDVFLSRLAEFNCAWNCSQFYDEKNSNTGHYVISLLKYLKIWDPTALWSKFAVNVCEGKPLEKHITIYPDFFHMDSKNSIPAMLSGAKAAECPRLKEKLLGYMKQLSDAPFKYDFSGYSDDTEIEAKSARTELEFMCELLRECGESYLRNMEDGVRAQRLLKKIMQSNYGQSLSAETWQHLKQLSDKHNQTFHKQMYNFPNFFTLIKPNQISEAIEKKSRQVWQTINQNAMQLGE